MKDLCTYLIFDGNCRKAMEFYKQCFGGELQVMTYAEAPESSAIPAQQKDWIIHARLQMKSNVLMASDTHIGIPVKQGNNYFVSIGCDTIQEAERYYKALGQGGTVEMPLQETFFAVRFAMVTDQFGIKWMLSVPKSWK